MNKFLIKLADIVIEINSIYDDVLDLCKDYIVKDENPVFSIFTNMDDITFERDKSISEAIYEGIPVINYENGYLETLSVYRKIVNKMLEMDICLIHGAAIALNGEAYLFTAKSGTGKTTHIKLWLNAFKDAYVINGDKPLLMFKDDKVYVCGTPWSGKENLNRNVIVPLKAICILQRDETNHIEKISFKEASNTLIQQIYKPKDFNDIKTTLGFVSKLGKLVPIYKLGCNMEDEAAIVSYEGMNK